MAYTVDPFMSQFEILSNEIEREMGRARKLVLQRQAGEQLLDFDIRGGLYDLAVSQVAPDARGEDLSQMFQWVRPLVDEIGLDIAPGNGFFTRPFRRAVGKRGHIVAIDSSHEMLEKIKRDVGFPIHTIMGSPDQVTMAQIADSSVNFTTSFGGLHHVPDQGTMMVELARVLVPGGRFVAADVGGGTALATHFDEVVAKKSLTGHTATWLSDDRLRELTKGLDLEVVQTKIVPLTWWFANHRQMALFFKGFHAYDLSENEIVADLENTLGIRTQNEQVGLHWPMLFFDIRKG